MNKLRQIDLNLLVTLHALLTEKHVSRAALRLHKSQPAVSHALASLRDIFADPLLVRREGKLELSTRASELLPALNAVLEQLGALLSEPAFEPGSAKRQFRLAMSDYGAEVILPRLTTILRQHAKHLAITVVSGSREAMLAGVYEGETDIAFGVFEQALPPELHSQRLFTERFVCAAAKASLPPNGMLTKAQWLARDHLLVAVQHTEQNEIEKALAREGVTRPVMLTLPYWSVASQLVANTDLVLTAASRSLAALASDSQIHCFAPPFNIAPFAFTMLWHSRRESDAAHNWLRQLIMQLFSDSAES